MNQQIFDVRRTKALAAAAYAIASMFVFIPLMELGTQLGWTAHPGVLNWRTGAVGLLSGATLTPIFGIFLALLTATALGHRWVQWGLGGLAALGGILLLGTLVVFALDALQLRPIVTASMRRSFDLAAVKAMVSFTAGSLTLLVMAFVVFSAAGKSPEETAAERRAKAANAGGSGPLVRTRPLR